MFFIFLFLLLNFILFFPHRGEGAWPRAPPPLGYVPALPPVPVWGESTVLLSSVNFVAEMYAEHLDRQGKLITEPPMTMGRSDAGLEGVKVAILVSLATLYKTWV